MKLRSRILYRCLLLPVLLMAWGCDDLSKDVVPPEDKIDKATDLTSTLAVNGPVLVDVVYSTSLTGNATISIVEQPARGTLAILNSALLKYTPNQDFTSGNDYATYKVCVDGQCDTGRINFNYVTPDGQCQVAAVYDHVRGKSTAASVFADVLDNDIACGGQFDATTLKIVTQPEHGEAVLLDGLIHYKTEQDYRGTVHLIYSVALSSAPSVLYYGAVDIDLQPVPVAAADAFSYSYENFLDYSHLWSNMTYPLSAILGNDQLNGLAYSDLTINITRQPAHGTVTYNASTGFVWNPGGTAFSGADSFVYQICYAGQCTEAEVQITIAEQAGPKPTAMPDSFSWTRSQIYGGAINLTIQSVLDNDDFDGLSQNQVSVSVSAQTETTAVELQGMDMFRLVPTASFAGQTSFKYQLCYQGRCSEATVTVVVTDW